MWQDSARESQYKEKLGQQQGYQVGFLDTSSYNNTEIYQLSGETGGVATGGHAEAFEGSWCALSLGHQCSCGPSVAQNTSDAHLKMPS